MEKFTPLAHLEHEEAISSNGIILNMCQRGRPANVGVDFMYPYIIISLNLRGTAHFMYDMQDIRTSKNDLTFFLPGHIIRPLEHSEDYEQAWLVFDPSKFENSELKFNANDLKLFYQVPICHLTDEQTQNLLSLLSVINYIASRTEEELPNKHHLLEQQLSLAYELYMYIRHDQDQAWNKNPMGHIYLKFCDLVVEHHREERNVNYYAEILGYDPRYFSKIFRAYSGGTTALEWIRNYITTRAKRMMDENPRVTVKEMAFELGFPNAANFCRYFKTATNMTPQQYKDKSAQH